MASKEELSDAEGRLATERAKHAALKIEFYSRLKATIEKTPNELTKFYLEVVLQIDDPEQNPFSCCLKSGSHKELFGDLAKIIISKIDGLNEDRNEYVPLTRIIADYFHYGEYSISAVAHRSKNLDDFLYEFIHSFEEDFAYSCLYPCTLVNQGMVLYRQNDSGVFSRVSDEDRHFKYMFMKGHYGEITLTGNYPEWTKEYYFKNEHILAHRRFFDGFEGDAETLQLRRKAFRAHIDEGDIDNPKAENKDSLKNRYESRLMGLLAKVQDRYYGGLFDPNNRETWPTQATITDWLKSNHGLSHREAESIDIVLRPDMARRK
ncbi:MAG: hypothetical protein V4563_16590 [Pseudomonadota bacterium]